MSYEPRSYDPYAMEKKLNGCVGGGGFDPSVLEEIQEEISVLGSENATMAQDITDIKGSLNSLTAAYSTTEHLIGRKWTDGKDIYEKTLDFGALPNATSKSVSTGVTIDTLVSLIGVAKSGTEQLLLPAVSTGDAIYGVSIHEDNNNIIVTTGSDRSSYTATVTIQYTKATPAPEPTPETPTEP